MIVDGIVSPCEFTVTVNVKNLEVSCPDTLSICRSTVHILGVYLAAVYFTDVLGSLLIGGKQTSGTISPYLTQPHAHIRSPDDTIRVIGLRIYRSVVGKRTSYAVVKPLRADIEAVTPLKLYLPACGPHIVGIHFRLSSSID